MRRKVTVACLVLAASLTHGALANAQALREETVSRELAEALLMMSQGVGALFAFNGGPASRASITSGRLPPEMSARTYVPPGSRVLGGYSTGAAAVAVLFSTLPQDSIAAMYTREQKKLGWAIPEQEQRPAARMPWGFVDPPQPPITSSANASGLRFCSGGDALIVGIERTGTSEQRIMLLAGNFAQMLCPRSRPEPPFQIRGNQYPTLYHPRGSGRDQCVDYSSSGGGQDGRVTSSLSPDSLLAHYAKQLADSGWRAVDTRAVAQRFVKSDSTKERILEISASTVGHAGPLCREVNMRYWEWRK